MPKSSRINRVPDSNKRISFAKKAAFVIAGILIFLGPLLLDDSVSVFAPIFFLYVVVFSVYVNIFASAFAKSKGEPSRIWGISAIIITVGITVVIYFLFPHTIFKYGAIILVFTSIAFTLLLIQVTVFIKSKVKAKKFATGTIIAVVSLVATTMLGVFLQIRNEKFQERLVESQSEAELAYIVVFSGTNSYDHPLLESYVAINNSGPAIAKNLTVAICLDRINPLWGKNITDINQFKITLNDPSIKYTIESNYTSCSSNKKSSSSNKLKTDNFLIALGSLVPQKSIVIDLSLRSYETLYFDGNVHMLIPKENLTGENTKTDYIPYFSSFLYEYYWIADFKPYISCDNCGLCEICNLEGSEIFRFSNILGETKTSFFLDQKISEQTEFGYSDPQVSTTNKKFVEVNLPVRFSYLYPCPTEKHCSSSIDNGNLYLVFPENFVVYPYHDVYNSDILLVDLDQYEVVKK